MAKAQPGGQRIGGRDYDSGSKLPDRYRRQLEPSERPRDPAGHNPAFAPNMGRFVVPQVISFSGISTSLSRAYRSSDEAVRHSVENAHMMLLDPVIAGPLFARQMMTALLQWSISSEDDKDPKLKEVSTELTKIVERTPRFTELKRWLMEAIWYGRCASQHAIGFHTNRFGKRWRVVRDWAPISGDKLLFRYNDGSYDFDPNQIGIRVSPMLGKDDLIGGRRRLEATGEGMGYFLEPWERRHVAVHKHMIRDGEFEDPISGGQIHGVGLRHFLYWVWWQKAETMAQVMEVIERTGMGFTIYFYPAGNPTAKEEVTKIAREQAHTNVIVLPSEEGEPYGVQQIPPNTAGLQVLHDIVESFFGDLIVRFILGQTLSTKPAATGMNTGVADLQKDSLNHIIRYDAINLEETLTKELLLPLRDFNFPKYRNVDFFFKISTKVSAPKDELAAIMEAWQMGAKIKVQDLFAKLDMAMPEKDDQTVFNPQVVSAIMQIESGQMPQQPGMPGAGMPGAPGQAPGQESQPPFTPLDEGQESGGMPDEQGGEAPAQLDKEAADAEERKKLFGPILYSKDIDERIAKAVAETHTEPTDQQRAAGNYKKGRFYCRGLEIAIENPKGTARKAGWQPLVCHYGYIARHSNGNGSEAAPYGKDDDKVDCFLGPHTDSEIVFVIDQQTEGGRFNEHKCILFARSAAEAKDLYLANYPTGWQCGPIHPVTWDQFRDWLAHGDTTKPMAGQVLRYAKRFDEEEHPRDDDGKFVEKDDTAHGTQKSGSLQSATHSGKGKDYRLTFANGESMPEHLSSLRLPPAWTNITVNPHPDAHLVATGYDAKGRRQSVYSQSHSMRQAAAKFSRIGELRQKFPAIMDQNKTSDNDDLSQLLALIAHTGLRPGSDRDTKAEKQAYGATTLRGEHVVNREDGVHLVFTGKKGVDLDIPVQDEELSRALLARKQRAGDTGKLFDATDDQLREYVSTLDGGGFKPKDFRTHRGTALAAELVKENPSCCQSEKEYKRAVRDVAVKVSKALGNTPTIALQSYIDPHIFSAWRASCENC